MRKFPNPAATEALTFLRVDLIAKAKAHRRKCVKHPPARLRKMCEDLAEILSYNHSILLPVIEIYANPKSSTTVFIVPMQIVFDVYY